MTNQEAIEFLKNMIDRESIGFVAPSGEGDVAIWQYHVEALQMAIKALELATNLQPTCNQFATDCISRQAVYNVLDKMPVRGFKKDGETIHGLISLSQVNSAIINLPSAQPEPCEDAVSRNAIIQKLNTMDRYVSEELRLCDTDKKFPQNEVFIVDDVYEEIVENLPSAQPEWNNHTVACMLAELFDDDCACNYNGIDEWLPEKCEVIDACPNPAGVACWEQYLKHRAERKNDEADYRKE